MNGIDFPHDDAITISTHMCVFRINNVMIDIDSSADVLFNRAYEKMALMLLKKLKPYDHQLYGFNGAPVKVRGVISLPIEIGDKKHVDKHEMDFLIIDFNSPYTVILGCLTLLAFRMIVSHHT